MRVLRDPIVITGIATLVLAALWLIWLSLSDPTGSSLLRASELPIFGWPTSATPGIILWNFMLFFGLWLIGTSMARAADKVLTWEPSVRSRLVLFEMFQALIRVAPLLLLIVAAVSLARLPSVIHPSNYDLVSFAESLIRLPHYCLLLVCLHMVFQRSLLRPWIPVLMAFSALNLHAWYSQYLYYYWAQSWGSETLATSWIVSLAIAGAGLCMLWLIQRLLLAAVDASRWLARAAIGLLLLALPVAGCIAVLASTGHEQLTFLPFPLRAVLHSTYIHILPILYSASGYHANHGNLLEIQQPFFGWMLPGLLAFAAYLALYGFSLVMWLITGKLVAGRARNSVEPELQSAARGRAAVWTFRLIAVLWLVSAALLYPWYVRIRADWGEQSPPGTVFSDPGWSEQYVMPEIGKWRALS